MKSQGAEECRGKTLEHLVPSFNMILSVLRVEESKE